jgi:hypothetical protein
MVLLIEILFCFENQKPPTSWRQRPEHSSRAGHLPSEPELGRQLRSGDPQR